MNINTSTSYVSPYIGEREPVTQKTTRATQIAEALEQQRTQKAGLTADQLAAQRSYTGEVSSDIADIQGFTPEYGSVWDNPKKNPLHDEVERARQQLEMDGTRAAEILLKHFDYLDNLSGTKTKKKIIDVNDLKLALNDKNLPNELRRAIEYLLSNPALIDEMNTCGVDKNDDDKFGKKDFEGYLLKQKLIGAATTEGQPASWPRDFPIPTLPSTWPPAWPTWPDSRPDIASFGDGKQ